MGKEREEQAREKRGEAREEREVAREERGVSREDREVKREEGAVEMHDRALKRDETSEDASQALRKARIRVRLVVGAIGTLALLAVASTVLLFLPYTPMTVYSYEAIPPVVCPGELLSVEVDYSLDAPVSRIEVDQEWVAVDVKGIAPGQVLEGPESAVSDPDSLQTGRQVIKSSILRTAPPEPGVWRLGSVLTVSGLRITQVQTLTPESGTKTTVLPSTDAACKRGA